MSSHFSPPIIKDKILHNISTAIREIHRLIIDDNEHRIRKITNDHWQVHCLLEHLDFALLYGLKMVQDGYYKCVCQFTPKILSDQINSLINTETDIGRGRAWLFFALNDNLTESYMKCFQDNKNLVKKFYTSDSIVSDIPRLVALTTICSGLENIQFELKTDCTYFDRSCWPAYLQVDSKEINKITSSNGRYALPTVTSYLSKYNTEQTPAASPTTTISSSTTLIPIKRPRASKRTTRTATITSAVEISTPSDALSTTPSRSLSISYDNPSMDEKSLNDENHIPDAIPIPIESPIPVAASSEISSSLSELDPMLKNRSPSPSPIVDEPIQTEETVPIEISIEKLSLTETLENPPSIIEEPSLIIENESPITTDNEPSIITDNEPSITTDNEPSVTTDNEPSVSIEDSMNESMSSTSMSENIFQVISDQDDAIDIAPDANIQLQFTLEIYESPNDEEFIKLFPTIIGHNNGNPEVVFLLITTLNIYLLRQLAEAHDSSRIERIECTRLEQIDYIEIGPNDQFLRIITVKHTKLRTLTTGCVQLTRAICDSIRKAIKLSRIPEPQFLPATMQEISIKKELAKDMKKDSVQDVNLLNYHYTFWEEPQMSGRQLRKEGYLSARLIEQPNSIRRFSAVTIKMHRHGFESWRDAYVTLRVDRLNVYLHKSDMNPALSYTLLDENCQGCRRNRNSDRPHAIEIMFANDMTLILSAKSKTEQDEWLNAVMKGLSQGRMAAKEEGNTENTVPCSVMLTDEKIYVCHDEQDNALIRQLDSMKLDYVTRLLVDPQYQYYCVLSIEHGIQGGKSWIFYFLYTKEMIQFTKAIQKTLSDMYQIPFDITPLTDISFQNECERTSKRLLRTYHPTTLIP